MKIETLFPILISLKYLETLRIFTPRPKPQNIERTLQFDDSFSRKRMLLFRESNVNIYIPPENNRYKSHKNIEIFYFARHRSKIRQIHVSLSLQMVSCIHLQKQEIY